MHRIVEFSLRNRFLVGVLVLIAVVAGVYNLGQLPIDAVPDITPNQVLVITQAPGLGPVEVERFITFPVETAMSGLPGIDEIRSTSRFGLSVVYVYFEEDLDLYFARRLVMERLPAAREMIPEGFGTPEMGPISTGLGEIYQFEVRGEDYSPMELRSILEWDIAFQLRSVPGVVEVNSFGGELKTYEVQIDADSLVAYNLSLDDVVVALEENNFSSGGGYIETNGEQQVIRAEGLVETIGDIETIVVGARNGVPIYVRNVAEVAFAPRIRQGAVTRDGRGEAVTGVVMMLFGANARVVAEGVDQRLAEIAASLPEGVVVETYYDRTDLVQRTIGTVTRNLTEGGLLVIAVLLLFLGNLRGGLVVAAAIPLSMLLAFTGMVYAGISGNLMSLGAIDFGLVVDGSVIMIENIVRKLSEQKDRRPGSSMPTIMEAGREVARPVFFAVLIIMIVYLPILTLEGVEGKMFRPMALTVIFALAGSLVLSLTFMPMMASLVFRKGVSEKETWIVRMIKRGYIPNLRRISGYPVVTAAVATAVFSISVLVALNMGAEFIPRLEEGAIAIQAWRLPSVALTNSVDNTTLIERTLRENFPEVTSVISRTGQAEIPTDPMGVEVSDIYVLFKPPEEWTTADSQQGMIAAMEPVLEENVPGTLFSFSQPIELRMQELIAGVRSDIAINLYGEDLDVLNQKANEIVQVVSGIPGAADVQAEQTAGLPYLRIRIDRAAIARYGINASEILEVAETVGGKVVGQVLEGQRRFDLQVRFMEKDRGSLDQIRQIRVTSPSGQTIPLSQLAEVWVEEGPAQISRANIQRRISVSANVRGRDIASFVATAQQAVGDRVDLPAGYRVEWGGQFENLQRASLRLAIVLPIALFLIFMLLYSTFNAAGPALLIFLNVPLAATGGVFALAFRGMPFSISAGVGFIAVSGVAVMNGVVLLSHVQHLRQQGLGIWEAVERGALEKMRAMLMAPLVAAMGFLPMAIAKGAGAEVQRPLATVVIGGLVTSTLLTLVVVPVIYRWFDSGKEEVEL